MGIGQTGRIIERADFKTAINIAVDAYDRKKKYRNKKAFVNNFQPTTKCSKCSRKMRKDMADIQIANKREDAPICVACILGRPRSITPKPLYSGKTQKAFIKYKKTHKPKKFIKL